ncbi:zinc finger protein 184-like [Leguminivora glycinivorella]|uniref:zinc finger protein 184-like n=1 Tax=Leguminivora glycinivorella TaxID=1035111 RepID=UPI00200C6644|nr:zinc finger protein 184-like [Leguminivora glycinivorella]
MSLEGAKYVWVELEPVWQGPGLKAKQEQEITDNLKTELKSEPEEKLCVISETAGAGLHLKHEEPESAQAGNLDQVKPEVKAESENLASTVEPAMPDGLCKDQESIISHIDPVVKAALKEEDNIDSQKKYSSWIEPIVLDSESESESASSMDTADQAGLYLKHEVEDGVMVGPEVYHKASFNRARNPPERTCTVSLERMHIDMERSVCRIGPNTYKFLLCSHQENDTSVKRRYSQRGKSANQGLYECPLCDFTSVHKHYIRVHKNIAHPNEKAKTWKTKQRKNIDKRPYKCNQCSYSSDLKVGLSIHKLVHTKKTAYKCSLCGYGYSHKYELQDHINTKHESEKVYKCDQCKFVTVHKDRFISHKKMHSKSFPYKCNQCNLLLRTKIITRSM